MAEKVTIKQLWKAPDKYLDKTIHISGWARTNRTSKAFGFIEVNDGTLFKNIQIVYNDTLDNFAEIHKITLGSSIEAEGVFIKSEGAKQPYEIQATAIKIIGLSNPDYPIQKKRHTLEYLRTMPHLRVRTNTFMAVFRLRSVVAYAIHKFFQERGFVYVHTPIITTNDCEGAGQMFQVSTMDLANVPLNENKEPDFSEELLGRKTYLTVSGQLAVEPFCNAFRNVYTFGPTFRAENSNTPRHANEFWMIEPEIAFAGLDEDMDLAEDMMKFIISDVLEKCPQEMAFFNQFMDKELINRLKKILDAEFARISYTKAVDILEKSGQKFEYPAYWGCDLQTEHERYLTEKHYKKPVFVTDYPKEIKAFYMKLNEDDKTVRAMDLLVPAVGEIVGGSQREERLDVLMAKFKEHNIEQKDYEAYIDLRKYGTYPHAGFGLGFERAVMYLSGIKNIRDVIPYPRTPNYALS